MSDDTSSKHDDEQSLELLRARIDAIDLEVLRLMSNRNGVVGEIAGYKRNHRVPIRDPRRENEIIGDRRDHALALGLNPETVESIYRLVMWESRDRQAALRAEVPLNLEPRTVAIIGGKGAMGRCMSGLFSDLGHPVLIADLDTELTPVEAAKTAEVVIISVPIDSTVEVIRQIGPHVREGALLTDVTSTKTEPVTAMLESTRADVVGLHPLFGPSVHSLQGQRIALTPKRGDEWLAWLEQMFKARGLVTIRTTPEDHDRAMAVVQVLTHFSTEATGLALARYGVPFEKTLEFTSPVYLMETLMTARHFAQSPELYASIQMSNPETPVVIDTFKRAVESLEKTVADGDRDAVVEAFGEVRQYFGSFTEKALEQSSYLIDRLVERS
jgi:chorismate mutase/prephenate dehydrogenase